MSAPNTDPEKQAKNHKPPLLGMGGVTIFAAILLAAFVGYLSFFGNEPGNDVPIDAESPAAD